MPDESATDERPSPPDRAGLFEAYRQMLAFLFLSSLVLIALLAVSLFVAEYKKVHLTILPFVALSGALGAFFSALTRLYSLERLPAALIRPGFNLRNWHLLVYALIPSITGMIGAVFFYVAIAAGLIQGELFQHFECAPDADTCDSLTGLLSFSPATVKDYAKALVWGFVSGFSERLVPDALSRFEKSGKTS
jgi:hypothetical protein